MDVELIETRHTARVKLIKILAVNVVIWTFTFVGYHYIPVLFDSGVKGGGRLAAIIFMGPVIALYFSIVIGTKEQRVFACDAQGFRFGGPISGLRRFAWDDLGELRIEPKTNTLSVRAKHSDSTTHLDLRPFNIGQDVYEFLIEKSNQHQSRE